MNRKTNQKANQKTIRKTARKTTLSAAGVWLLASAVSVPLFSAAQPCIVLAESVITSADSKGTLTITKRDTTEEKKPTAGAVYTAYKIMSLTPGGKPGQFASCQIEPAYREILKDITPDELKNYSALETEAKIRELEAAAKGDTGTVSKATDASGKTTLTLPLGWYLVVETTAPAGTVAGAPFLISMPSTDNITTPGGQEKPGTAWNYNLSAEPKSPRISVSKNIINGQGARDSDYVKNNTHYTGKNDTAAEGDVIHYEVCAAVPEYGESFFYENKTPKFEFRDTLSPGLTVFRDSTYPVEVKVGDTVIQEKENYTLTLAPSDNDEVPDLTIAFQKAFLRNEAYKGKEVHISYYARLNEQAVMGDAGNPNNVKMYYSSTPGTDADPVSPEPDGDTPVPDTYVYTYGIRVNKFSEETVAPLKGAKFAVYKDEALKEPLKDKNQKEITGTTDETGALMFPRLDAGTYYLKEVESPAGYSLLTNPIKVELIPSTKADSGEITGGAISFKLNDTPITASSGEQNSWLSVKDGIAAVAVRNHRGFSLPATGGPGVLLLLAVSAAGILTLSFFLLRPLQKKRN